MIWAIIVNETVDNIIIADEDFINNFYPNAICIDDVNPRPNRGWKYINNTFESTDEVAFKTIDVEEVTPTPALEG